MLQYSLPEKRRDKRLHTKIPIICEIIDKENNTTRERTFITYDINSSGVYFIAEEALPLNTEMKASFQLPKSINTINAAAKVVRLESTDDDKKYGIGAVFTGMASKDKDEIQRLIERLNISKLLDITIQNGASDLHLLATQAPVLRIRGELKKIDVPEFDPNELQELLYSIMSKEQVRRYSQKKELDFGIQYDSQNRFRINIHQQKGFMEATLRLINTSLSSFEELNIPESVKSLARLKDGLVIISGPTGSGKTTTIAAMIELINREEQKVIVMLERPIEYIFTNKKSIVKQREVGVDTYSFSEAIKSSLRQDPNVIMVGEVDDIETVKTSLTAAESGYLVLASLHAPNTLLAIDRLIGLFQPENRKQMLTQLANCLKGIVSQMLIPCNDRSRRVLASEVLMANDAVKRVIRTDQLMLLPTIIQTGSAHKMQYMEESIKRILDKGLIDKETADYYSEEFSKQTKLKF